jgi:hypothetical protein
MTPNKTIPAAADETPIAHELGNHAIYDFKLNSNPALRSPRRRERDPNPESKIQNLK